MDTEVYRNILYRSNILHLLAMKVAVEQKRSFFDRGTNEYVNWSQFNPSKWLEYVDRIEEDNA